MKEKSSTKHCSQKACHGKNCVWLAAAAVVLILLLAVGLWYVFRDGENVPDPVVPDTTQSDGTTLKTEPVDPTGGTELTSVPGGEGDQQTTGPQSTEGSETDEITQPGEVTQPTEDTQPTQEIPPESTQPSTEPVDPPVSDGYVSFIEGISISPVEKYTGMYMEDGTGEMVSDIMMIIVRNDTSTDLQLARIEVEYEDTTAFFQVTNLPAGKSAVVLEQNRKAFIKKEYRVINIYDVVFFQKNMSLCEDRVKVSGSKGSLEIENISSETLGIVYVYFKNVASDGLLYGGITYRTTFEAGLVPGETRRVTAGHFDPDFTTIMLVQIADNVT